MPLLRHNRLCQKDVTCELERTAISLPAELTLNRFTPDGLAQSQVLHRLAILEIPGIVRQQGSTLTLAGNGEERWKLTRPLSQHAALIEAACFGATLQEAARNKLEADMLDAGGIGSITTCLSQAALAGLASFSQQLLEQLTLLIASVVAHGWSEDRSVQTWKTPQFCSDASACCSSC